VIVGLTVLSKALAFLKFILGHTYKVKKGLSLSGTLTLL